MRSVPDNEKPADAVRRRPRRPMPPGRRGLYAGLAIAIGLAGAAVLAEAAVRFYLTWRTRGDLGGAAEAAIRDPGRELGFGELVYPDGDPLLIYRLRPGTRGRFAGGPIEINSLGFRGPELQTPRPGERRLRIEVLGDSHAFGWGVGNDDPFPAQLEQALERMTAAGVRPEVIGMGVPGYNAVQEAQAFLRQGAALQPDVVLIQYCLNDNVLPSFLTRRDYLTNYRRSYLWDLLKGRMGGDTLWMTNLIEVSAPPGQPYEMDPAAVPRRYLPLLGWQPLEQAYERLKGACDREGIPVYVVLPTEYAWELFKWGQDRPTHDPHYDKIRELCARLGIPVIDSFGAIYDFVTAHGFVGGDLMVNPPADTHPNRMKHNLIAQAILEALAPELEKRGAIDTARLPEVLEAMRQENEELAASHAKIEPPKKPLLD